MARNWEIFDEPSTPRLAELHVSMSPAGTMLLSRNTYAAMGDPSHVVMLWDARNDTVGIRPVPPRTLNAFRVYPTNRAGAYRFHAMRFLVKHDIKLSYTVRFPTAEIEDGVLILELPYRVRSPHAVRPLSPRTGRAERS